MKKAFIFTNITEKAQLDKTLLVKRIEKYPIEISERLTKDVDLIFCVGGDGTLLKLVQKYGFPTVPICGVNTGHVGFFQEIDESNLDKFLDMFINDHMILQPYNIVKAVIKTRNGTITHHALNEFVIRSFTNNLLHLDISINESFIENFSGDGILVSSPAGSTAYNYSLSGSLVDPRLNLLQLTPMAPMNTKVYRSLTSSILLPFNDEVILVPGDERSKTMQILYDGEDEKVADIESICLTLSKRKINIVRSGEFTFWDKIKDKFL